MCCKKLKCCCERRSRKRKPKKNTMICFIDCQYERGGILQDAEQPFELLVMNIKEARQLNCKSKKKKIKIKQK